MSRACSGGQDGVSEDHKQLRIHGDGAVNIVDAIAAIRYSVGNRANTLRDGVDVNSDGKVNAIDALTVIRYVVGDNINLGVVVNADGTVKEDLLYAEYVMKKRGI